MKEVNGAARRSLPISKQMIWQAYRKVKANQGSAGIDGESMEQFEENLSNNLYKLWNRMASGSYFPPAIKGVSIPKKNGKFRMLGIPTVSDRIAQMVLKDYLEPKIDPEFHSSSFIVLAKVLTKHWNKQGQTAGKRVG